MKTLSLALVVVASTAHAGKLKELIDAADKNNFDRRISIQTTKRASAEAVQAWTTLLPTVLLQGIWTHNQYFATFDRPLTDEAGNPIIENGKPKLQTLVIQPAQQYDGIFRLDVPLIDVSRWFRIAASSSAEAAALEREEVTLDGVHRAVIGAYYGYAAALAVRGSAKRSVKVAEAQAQLQEIRASAGAATELERLRAAAEVQRNKQFVADAENLVAVSRRNVLTLTGIDPGDEAVLPPDDMRPEAPFQELEKNVDNLHQVRAAEHDIKTTSRVADANRLLVVPTIGGQFTERVSTLTGFTGQPASYNGGLTLTWRLDAPTIVGYAVQNANEASSIVAAERTRALSKDQIFSDWQRLDAALVKVVAAAAQYQAADRAAQVARDRYAAGAATQIDVIAAERDLLQTEVMQIQARTELAGARLGLRISAGQPLGLE